MDFHHNIYGTRAGSEAERADTVRSRLQAAKGRLDAIVAGAQRFKDELTPIGSDGREKTQMLAGALGELARLLRSIAPLGQVEGRWTWAKKYYADLEFALQAHKAWADAACSRLDESIREFRSNRSPLTPSANTRTYRGMPKKKRPELTDEERAKRLKEAAREAGATESREQFERVFKAVAGPKPKADHPRRGGKPPSP